jgi:MoxR-like ATPase
MRDIYERMREAVNAVVLGQDEALAQITAALLCRGHVLIQGPPGVAKTLLARAVARTLGVAFTRAQFTPDMLPSDLTGTMVLRGGELAFRSGPVFTNILLADEINRTPPKTQAALLEAMQEGQVSVDGSAHSLPDPFLVIATQNPIEYEGTYPLPEAQLDRFLLEVQLGYPDATAEQAMLSLPRAGLAPSSLDDVAQVISGDELRAARHAIDATRVTGEVAGYVTALVRRTRALPSVSLGASPRAAVHLLVAAKAGARMAEREFVTPDDVAAIAPAALAHRLILTPEAELDGFTARDAIAAAIREVPVPR